MAPLISRSNSLRTCASTPGLIMIRPADANEVREAWKVILQLHHEPAALVLTRQAVPTHRSIEIRSGVGSGARRLCTRRRARRRARSDPDRHGQRSVTLCLDAYEQLANRRREGARRQHAFLGDIRRPGCSRTGIRCCLRT